MNNIVLFMKGLIIGMGKVIPGVSGSVLAILLGVYEKCINIISHPFKNMKENFIYLFILGLGIIISIVLGSKILLYLLKHHYIYTFFLIIGFILGTIPNMLKEIKIKNKYDILLFILPILILIMINNLKFPLISINSYLLTFIIGLIESITTIIPGISSTAIYMFLDVYPFFLTLFTDLFSLSFFLFGISFLLGIILTSKMINYLLFNFRSQTYIIITSLMLSSIALILKNVVNYSYNIKTFFLSFLVFSLGFFISKKLDM